MRSNFSLILFTLALSTHATANIGLTQTSSAPDFVPVDGPGGGSFPKSVQSTTCEVHTSCSFIGWGGSNKNIAAWTHYRSGVFANCPEGYNPPSADNFEHVGENVVCDSFYQQFGSDHFTVSNTESCICVKY